MKNGMKRFKTLFSHAATMISLMTASMFFLVACTKENAKEVKKVSIEVSTEGESDVIVTLGDRQMLTNGSGKAKFTGLEPKIYTVKFVKDGFHSEWRQVDVLTKDNNQVNVHMNPVTITALITSEPDGAKILIDGMERGTTPFVYKDFRLIGEYEIQASRAGTDPVTKKMSFNSKDAGKPVAIAFDLVSNRGKLHVVTNPADALCTIKGLNIQFKASETLDLPEGEYDLVVTLDGYKPGERKVLVEREKTTEQSVELIEQPGLLEICVNLADAEITLDGNQVADYSKPLEVKPGSHTIVARKTGFPDATQTIEVGKGEHKKCDLVLDNNLGSVTFTINPPGTQISIDVGSTGKKIIVGVSQPSATNPENAQPFVIKGLPPGKHTLYFNHPYAPKQKHDHHTFMLKPKSNDTIPDKTLAKFWVANVECTHKETQMTFQRKILPSAENSKEVKLQKLSENGDGFVQYTDERREYSSIKKLPIVEIDPKYNYSTYDLVSNAPEGNESNPPAPAETKMENANHGEEMPDDTKSPKNQKETPGKYTLKIATPLPSYCIIFIDGKSYGHRTEISGLPEKISLRIQGKQDINANITFNKKNPVRVLKLSDKHLEKLTTKKE